jgi:hypothetical protein
MKRFHAAIIAGLLGVSLVAMRGYADDNKGPNTSGKAPAAKDSSSSVQTATIAGQLADWAREHHDAVALATAAHVLAADAPQPMPSPKKTADGGTGDKPVITALASDALLAEAKALAGANADVAAAVDSIAKSTPEARGHVGGAYVDSDVLLVNQTITYTLSFTGGDSMEIGVVCPFAGDITYHVYDENNNEISSMSTVDFLSVPKWTGQFRVVLVNNTNRNVPYTMATN